MTKFTMRCQACGELVSGKDEMFDSESILEVPVFFHQECFRIIESEIFALKGEMLRLRAMSPVLSKEVSNSELNERLRELLVGQ